jgi:hypothetical protein
MNSTFSNHIVNKVTSLVFYEYIYISSIVFIIFLGINLLSLNLVKKKHIYMIEVNNYKD